MKRGYGDGSVTQRGRDTWFLRYRVEGKRLTATVHGSKTDAQRELRRLIRQGDEGTHVAPDRMTLQAWSEQWLALLARGDSVAQRRGIVSARTRERYSELLASYVLPSLGAKLLQRVTVTEIDQIYLAMEKRGLSVSTVRHTHTALKACLGVAMRKGLLNRNPATDASVPPPIEPEVGVALDADDVKRLLDGFRDSVLYPIVATAVFTGARRSEILALRWEDLDAATKVLRIKRAVETTTAHGRRIKEPKSKRGRRSVVVPDVLMAILLAERERWQRLLAGVSSADKVDLALVKLPPGALMFPSPPGAGEQITLSSLTKLRNGNTVSRAITERLRKLGFTMRFQDFRVTHGTALLDSNLPGHTVAARLGHSVNVLMKAYAKRSKRADNATADAVNALANGSV